MNKGAIAIGIAAVGGYFLVRGLGDEEQSGSSGGGGLQFYDPSTGSGNGLPYSYDPLTGTNQPAGTDTPSTGEDPWGGGDFEYIDQGTYLLDDETQEEIRIIEEEAAAEEKRQGRIQTGLIAAGTTPFVAKPIYKGFKAAATSSSRAARATRAAGKAAYVATGVYTGARNLGETAAAIYAARKGDYERARDLSARSVQRGTAFLSGGAVSIDPRGDVRLGTKTVQVDAPGSFEEAGENLQANLQTVQARAPSNWEEARTNFSTNIQRLKFW